MDLLDRTSQKYGKNRAEYHDTRNVYSCGVQKNACEYPILAEIYPS